MELKERVNEEDFEKIIEDKLMELIWHPERRDEVHLIESSVYGTTIHYLYKEDTPMSCFRELAMLLYYLGQANKLNQWLPKDVLVKCVQCMRKLPVWVREIHLSRFHRYAAAFYQKGMKAERHLRDQIRYAIDEEAEAKGLYELLEESRENPERYLAMCLEIFSYILAYAEEEEEDFFPWGREQYELVEKLLKEAITMYAEAEESPLNLHVHLYVCQAVYYKKTRRYVLAEKAMEKVRMLSEEKYMPFVGVELEEEIKGLVYHFMCPFIDEGNDYVAEEEEEDEGYDEYQCEEEDEESEYTFDELYELAEQGNAEARRIIGACYISGDGVTINDRVGAEWIKMAASQGDAIAQYLLGDLYREGVGVEQDLEQAEKWYRLSEKQGYNEVIESLKELGNVTEEE